MKQTMTIKPSKSCRLLGHALISLAIISLLLPISLDSQSRSRKQDSRTTTSADEEEEFAKDADTEINVKNADIAAVIKLFSSKTKRNYILDERVKGKVSIYLPGRVTPDDALRILESVLTYKGFTSVPIGENIWKIVPIREAKQSTIPTRTSSPDSQNKPTPAMITRLMSLRYIQADEARQLLQPMISAEGMINAYAGTNSLVIIDGEDNIVRLETIVNEIDVPYTDQDLTIIPILNASAQDVADKVSELMGLGDKAKEQKGRLASETPGLSPMALQRAQVMQAMANNPGNMQAAQSSTPQVAGGTIVAARSREPKLLADERTNSIILLADEETTLRIRALVGQLDSKLDLSDNKFYVYHCQYANADELSQVVSGLLGGEGGGSSSSSSSVAETAPTTSSSSSTGRNAKQSSTQSRLSNQSRSPGTARSDRKAKSSPTAVNIGDKISITADPATNSLVIRASRSDYRKIRELIEKLDVKRRQVLVEALILEVGVDESQELGMDFMISAGNSNGAVMARSDFSNRLAGILQNPGSVSSFAVAAASSGTITIGGGDNAITLPSQSMLLTALKSNSNVNVLSSPNILATDNEEAEIVVGENVPFVSSNATSDTNLNNTFQQIDRQDVGITLRITPQISSKEYVKLKIFTEVSRVIPGTETREIGPTTRQRSSETTVITKDAQMVVIGGLMVEDVIQSETGIPFLKDIPILGTAFKSTVEQHSKRNLLIFITPHIVKDQFDYREQTLGLAKGTQQTIEHYDIYPSRNEVLNSPALDKVTESKTYEGEKVTTIRPPPLEESKSIEKKPLEFSLKPQISNSENNLRFVVFKITSGHNADLPFATTQVNQELLLAVEIPQESDPKTFEFFKTGYSYRYLSGLTPTSVKVVGKFDSPQKASSLFDEKKVKWHRLSPYELLNLGDKPWKAG